MAMLSHGGTTIYTSRTPSREVLVGTVEGVFTIRRSDNSENWFVAGRALENCHISSLILEAKSGFIFAGVFHGGVWASPDGGRTWERCDESLAEKNVFTLASRFLEGRVRLFAGTEPAHLFFSDDLGKSWRELPALRSVDSLPTWTYPAEPHLAHVKHVNFAPRDARTLFVSIEQGGLLKSTDDGESWQDLHIPHPDVHRTLIDPRTPNKIMVTGGGGLWVTLDGGKTWENWAPTEHEIGGYPDQLVFLTSNFDTMFIAAAQKSPGIWRKERTSKTRISRSKDGGRTWEVLSGGLQDLMQPSVEAMAVEEAGENFALFAATTAGEVLYSRDGGNQWTTIIRGLPPISKGTHYRRFTEAAVA